MAQHSATDTVSLHVRLCDLWLAFRLRSFQRCHYRLSFAFIVSLLRAFVYILIIFMKWAEHWFYSYLHTINLY